MYSTWKVSELKEELKKRGASLRGKKADLVERLENYDRNFNIQHYPSNAMDEDPGMQLPAPELYRDVNTNTDLPPINMTQIRHYLCFTSKKIQKVVDLYESRHLVAVRSLKTSNNDIFIKAICRKTMKSLHYESNIKLDQFGNIEEASCECPAGSGTKATCKHVAIVLLAMEQLYSKKHLLLFETSTQKLQQFHVPKKAYYGTPVRAEKMKSKSKTTSLLFEPYPISRLNQSDYNSRVRNILLNYQNTTMPIKQMYEPANPYAIVADHSYITSNAETEKLKTLELSQITEEKIKMIEESTRLQNKSPEWHLERKKRITASKFHTVCHLKESSKMGFASQIFEQKEICSRATNHGIVNEQIALESYATQNELYIQSSGLFVSAKRPYLAASPDGLLGLETIIEVKCPYTSRMKPITPTTVPYVVEEDGVLRLRKTTPYFYQIQGQLYCTGRKYANLIIYTYVDLKIVYIDRDEKFISDMLIKLDDFYENYFKYLILDSYLYYNYKCYTK